MCNHKNNNQNRPPWSAFQQLLSEPFHPYQYEVGQAEDARPQEETKHSTNIAKETVDCVDVVLLNNTDFGRSMKEDDLQTFVPILSRLCLVSINLAKRH